MINQELLKYISYCLKKETPWSITKKKLLEAGWIDEVLEENYQEYLKNKISSIVTTPQAEEVKEKPLELQKEETSPVFVFEEKKAEPIKSINTEQQPTTEENPFEFKPSLSELKQPKQDAIDSIELPKETVPKNKGKLGLMLVIIAVLILIGGGVYAYINYFSNTPEKIIDKVIKNLSKVKSGEYYGTLNLEAIEGEVGVISGIFPDNVSKVTANFKGFFDLNDLSDIKGSLLVDANIQMAIEAATANFEIGMTGNSLYGLVNSVYLPQSAETQRNIMSLLTSNWVKYDIPDIDGQKISSVINNKIYGFYNNEQFKKDLASALSIKLIGVEKIDGIDCYHTQINFNKNETKIIIQDLMAAQGQNIDQVDFDNSYDDFFETLNKADIQAWISKSDFLLSKFYIKLNVSMDNQPAIMDLSFGIKNQNKQVKFNVPEMTKDWNDIMGSLGTALQGLTAINSNSLIEAQLNQLMVVAQTFKQSKGTYTGFISSEDGQKIVNDISALGGDVAGVVTAKNMYCIATKLLDDTYWCIDSAGNSLISNNCTKKTYSCK